MSDPGTPDPVQSPSTGGDPRTLIDAMMFPSDVNEVFLLIDHISGRSEKSLRDLDATGIELPPPLNAGHPPAAPPIPPTSAAGKPSVAEVLDALCQIGYPPNPDPMLKAHKASFILMLKDRLNALAAPARGVTVAYTAMFVSSTDGCSWRLRRRTVQPATAGAPVLRSDLAKAAYPGLEVHARCFARLFRRFPWLMALVLVLTASAYWDVGFGRTLVERIEQLDAQRTELLHPDRQKSPDAVPVDLAACKENKAAVGDPARACERLANLESQLNDSRGDLDHFANSALGKASDSLWWRALLLTRPIHYGFLFNGQVPLPGRPETSVAWVLSLFSTYVLPAFFGLLGTLAAITRAIQGKVRDSVLGPRDLPLSVLGLFVGPMAGLAVGLYYTPSGTAIAGSTGLAGAVSLSASGLGFLAGYGADAFFKLLDALLIRVFALDQSGK